MSAKNRGRETEENEFYPTDPNVVFALLESDLIKLPGGMWIEPCAGTGKIISAVNQVRSDVVWSMCELNPDFDQFLKPLARRGLDHVLPYGDFVHREWDFPMYDVLIMNPPFSLTMQFVKAALTRAMHVVCVQRQGWFGTKNRAAWLRQHCPDSLQLPWRPSFRPDGDTDNCEYCWYYWPPRSLEGRRTGRIAMLDKPKGGQIELL